MSDASMETVFDHFHARRRHDIDAIEAGLDPGVVHQGVMPELVCNGREAVVERVRDLVRERRFRPRATRAARGRRPRRGRPRRAALPGEPVSQRRDLHGLHRPRRPDPADRRLPDPRRGVSLGRRAVSSRRSLTTRRRSAWVPVRYPPVVPAVVPALQGPSASSSPSPRASRRGFRPKLSGTRGSPVPPLRRNREVCQVPR